ncbi:cyclic nucleotide-binding protein [Solimonas sp. K1W22B-7]|uniref:patatin-like phospholipase family protein n=1 Tax=Solimonas sp. K1W22B-7 TaxID=2303331 RepID=UPI000E32E7D7|nr:patatin-like phospholipase family protein [Solimonas sp. K1W22B-7]AXQ27545.1 cyclic nucleotide-binding protein [Solimonas sp. K1W22B-7]
MDTRTILAQTPLFSRLQPEALDALSAHTELLGIRSGSVLFEQGEPADSMYIVSTGRLRAVNKDGSLLGDIGHHEPIGEIGVISGEKRSVSVYAVRDSILLRIPREDLYTVIENYPGAMIEMTRVIIHRLRQNQHSQQLAAVRSVRSFAVIPALGDVDAAAVAAGLRDALSMHYPVRLVDSVLCDAELGPGAALSHDPETNGRLIEFLDRIECEQRYLVYLANRDADAWAQRCMRQADRILVVVTTRSYPIMSAMLDELRQSGTRAPVEVVMIRAEGEEPDHILKWRELSGARAHYYLRPNSRADCESLARQLSGRGIGVVLGGGGARGFAHIGMIRALRELDIPIDCAGGSSMGAFFAALTACGYTDEEMLHIARETFVSHNYLNDYIFPSVALIRGRKFSKRMHELFEERQIEALRMPYFCVSTNLTRGKAMVHDQGPLHLWVATSMCVPGVAPPVAWNGDLLADGAVINSLPTDVMQAWGRGPIVASDVSTEGGISAPGVVGPDPEALFNIKKDGERPGLFAIVFRTATLTSESGTSQRAARADAYVRMPVSGIALFDWKKLDQTVERGYQHALEKLTAVRDVLLKS